MLSVLVVATDVLAGRARTTGKGSASYLLEEAGGTSVLQSLQSIPLTGRYKFCRA